MIDKILVSLARSDLANFVRKMRLNIVSLAIAVKKPDDSLGLLITERARPSMLLTACFARVVWDEYYFVGTGLCTSVHAAPISERGGNTNTNHLMVWSAATATVPTSGLNFCLVGSALRTIPATLVFTDALHASQVESRRWPRCSCQQPSGMEPRAGLTITTAYDTGGTLCYVGLTVLHAFFFYH